MEVLGPVVNWFYLRSGPVFSWELVVRTFVGHCLLSSDDNVFPDVSHLLERLSLVPSCLYHSFCETFWSWIDLCFIFISLNFRHHVSLIVFVVLLYLGRVKVWFYWVGESVFGIVFLSVWVNLVFMLTVLDDRICTTGQKLIFNGMCTSLFVCFFRSLFGYLSFSVYLGYNLDILLNFIDTNCTVLNYRLFRLLYVFVYL